MGQGMKIQRGREKEPCRNGHICTSWSVPWASAGERETLNRLNMRWSWHLTDLDLGNPEWWNAWNGYKVMQEMRMQWRVGDDSPWGGWARSPLYLLWSQPLCPPEISYDKILIPIVMASIGGVFVRWWSYKDGASSMNWVLLYIRDTQISQSLPRVTIQREVCDQKGPCMTTLWKSISIVFKPVLL